MIPPSEAILIHNYNDCLTDDLLTEGLIDSLTDWLSDSLSVWLTDQLTDILMKAVQKLWHIAPNSYTIATSPYLSQAFS